MRKTKLDLVREQQDTARREYRKVIFSRWNRSRVLRRMISEAEGGATYNFDSGGEVSRQHCAGAIVKFAKDLVRESHWDIQLFCDWIADGTGCYLENGGEVLSWCEGECILIESTSKRGEVSAYVTGGKPFATSKNLTDIFDAVEEKQQQDGEYRTILWHDGYGGIEPCDEFYVWLKHPQLDLEVDYVA